MAQLLIYNSGIFDFVNGSTPRSINIYTVPTGQTLVLDEIEVVPLATTGSGNPSIDIGTSANTALYDQTLNQNSFEYLSSVPLTPQTAAAGTTIQATITSNSAASSQTGIVLIRGYLVPASGAIVNPPTPPTPSDWLGVFYCVDTGGNTVSGVCIEYAMIQFPDGSGLVFDGTVHTATSDGTGLVQIPMIPGATYKLWSGVLDPVCIPIPADAESPYSLPNFIYA
jgi:hypothetical protein